VIDDDYDACIRFRPITKDLVWRLWIKKVDPRRFRG
jgi:hypothetical protein